MNIVLIGMPGSGKTTIGRSLALTLNYKFIDLDELIQLNEQESIPTIFQNKGEQYFRKSEQNILSKLLIEEKQAVIATGGGAPCFFDNMELINKHSKSIYIDVPEQELFKRLNNKKENQRPMLQGKTEEELLDFIKTKKQERAPFYNRALYKISGTHLKAQDIIDALERTV
ncbi:MAG: shikimate kinase [Cytophagales bacterium]|nr:MAG: shikimate kinase [Cytophagales bacterium]